jgi:hypothetical protein
MTTFQQLALIFGVVMGCAVLVVALFCVFSRFLFLSIFNKEARAAARITDEQLSQLLLEPDFDAFNSHFGVAPARELRLLYEDAHVVTRSNLSFKSEISDDEYHIQRFVPMSLSALKLYDVLVGAGRFAVAHDEFGNCFFINVPGDGPVYFMDNDLGEINEVSDSVAKFHKLVSVSGRERRSYTGEPNHGDENPS